MPRPNRKALTQRMVETLALSDSRYVLWDERQTGLGLRVGKTSKVWIVQYRTVAGKERKATLGKVDQLTLRAARKKASELLVAVRDGADPAAEREQRRRSPTVDQALDEYFDWFAMLVDEGERKPRTLLDYRRQAARTIRPAIGAMRVAEVRRVDVRRTLDTIGGKVQRNRQRALLSAFFVWCEDEMQCYREPGTNPVAGIRKAKETPRDRRLSANEQAALSAAIDETVTDHRAAMALHVMAMTGWRVGEVRTLRWEDLRLDTREAVLSNTKTGRSRRRIPSAVCDVLASIEPVDGNAHVFAGDRGAAFGEKKLGILFRRACKAAGIKDGQLRDLRRTYASDLAAEGVNPFHIRDALGHKSLAMTDRVYVRLGSNDRLGDELDRAAERRAARQSDNVVDLRSA